MPKAIDSLDYVEMLIWFEEFFEVEFPDDPEFESPLAIVNQLEVLLSNRVPNDAAARFLEGLARLQERPALVPRPGQYWTREQIAAIVREITQ